LFTLPDRSPIEMQRSFQIVQISKVSTKNSHVLCHYSTRCFAAKSLGISSGDASTLSEEFLEVPNGCMCCTVKDIGIAAIENLMKKRGRFDYILLETTGLADPGGYTISVCVICDRS
jgi:hypothetical protein